MTKDEFLEIEEKAKRGDSASQFELACSFLDGELVNVDYEETVSWCIEAAQQQFEEAYNKLFALKTVENDTIHIDPQYIIEEKKKEAERIAAEELAKKEADEAARLAAEEEKKRVAEEDAKRKAEEKAQKDADRELKRKERERIRAEKEAKRQSEEEETERAIVKVIKEKSFDTLKEIVDDIIHIKGGTMLMGSPNDKLNLPHKETVSDFWISKQHIYASKDLMFNGTSENTIEVVQKIVKRLSLIFECELDIPPAPALEFALRGGENYNIDYVASNELLQIHGYYSEETFYEWTNTYIGEKPICISIKRSSDHLSYSHNYKAFLRLYSTDSKIEQVKRKYEELAEEKKRQAEEERRLAAEEKRRAEEERKKAQEKRLLQLKQQQQAIQQEKETKLKEEWNAVVESFLNDVETFEYESGFFFNRKRVQIRYVKQPLCERIYTAIKYRESLVEWEKQNEKFKDPKHNWIITSDWKLNEFIKKFNEYKGSECAFDFLHNYKDAEERLRKSGKIGAKGAYLIIK